MTDIVIRFDESEAEQGLDNLEKEAAIALKSISTNIRRTAEIALYFAEASGVAIDAVLRLYIETGLRTIEFLAAANAAVAAGTLGTGTILRLGAQVAAVALMFAQIQALQAQRTETARRLALGASGLRAFTF